MCKKHFDVVLEELDREIAKIEGVKAKWDDHKAKLEALYMARATVARGRGIAPAHRRKKSLKKTAARSGTSRRKVDAQVPA